LIVLFQIFFEVTETEKHSPPAKFRRVGWRNARNAVPDSLFHADHLASKNSESLMKRLNSACAARTK
jgi:hypothetical protein